MAANRIDTLIDQFDPILRNAFLKAVYEIRSSVQIAALTKMIERGNIEGALRAVGLDPIAFRSFDKALAEAFEAGGSFTARGLPIGLAADGLKLVVQFNVRNPSAEQWLRQHSSERVVEIVDGQRTMLRHHLTEGMQAGLNPRTVALDIAGRINPATGRREGGVVGLTDSQAAWVRAYREELQTDPAKALERTLRDARFDPAVRKAVASGEPIPADKIEAMVRSYQNRALKFRADAIGRTEAMAALHQAQDEAVKQGVEKGAVKPDLMTMIWRTAKDKRVRDTHRVMDGQKVKMGAKFKTGSGAFLAYPGDPDGPAAEVINCRCYRETKYDFLAGVK